MGGTEKHKDFHRLRVIKSRMQALRRNAGDPLKTPATEEFAALEREWALLTAKYGKSRVWNKQHRQSTRNGLKTVLRKGRRSRKQREKAEVRKDIASGE